MAAQRRPATEHFLGRTDIICISSIDWDFIWQGHQEIMSGLARQGNRVLFVENTGVRAPRLRDFPRLTHRIRNWWRGIKGFREEQPNLFVYSPLILPFPYSRLARWINRHLLLRALRRWILATSFGRPIIWTFLPTPLVRDLIRELDPVLTVYYCIDDLASSSEAAWRIRRSEAEMFRDADLVFVTSEKLRERAAGFRKEIHLFPFGVDFATFERVREGDDEIPPELRSLHGRIVGYIGGIHQWIDQELLAEVASRMPDTSFILVGPRQVDTELLDRCENVHFLGARSHRELPRYLKGFDVGIIPYRLHEYTANVYPTKLNEYLAMGIPVVTTDLPEVRRFNAQYGDVVAVARDPKGFETAIREAIRSNRPFEVEGRIHAARENSWSARVAKMSVVIEEALVARHVATAERWDRRLRYLYRRAWRRVAQLVAAVGAVYVLLFYTPVIWWVAEPLRVTEAPRQADAIVVIGGGAGETGRGGTGYEERVERAVELYGEGRARYIVFSSGYVVSFREVDVMRTLAVSLGAPPSAILLEGKSGATRESAVFVGEIVRQRSWTRVLLVSSPYHMRRAVWTFRKLVPEVEVVATPPTYSQFYGHVWGPSLPQVRGILQEYAAILYYWWQGWV